MDLMNQNRMQFIYYILSAWFGYKSSNDSLSKSYFDGIWTWYVIIVYILTVDILV